MTRLPRITGKEMLRALEEWGFILIRVKGSHHFVRHPDGRKTVVPVHASETLGPGLTSKILADAHLTRDELIEKL